MNEEMIAHNNTKNTIIFTRGLALSAAITSLVTAYSIAKNTSLDFLLYLFLVLIVMILIGVTITYFAYKQLSDTLEELEIPASPILIFLLHTVNLLTISKVLLLVFISFEIAYGYLLLPIAIAATGAVIFACIIRILRITALSLTWRMLFLIITTILIITLAIILK